jgi:opacity protein-like surface antigen
VGAYFTCVAEINLPLDEWNQNPGRHRRSEMKKFLAIVGLLTAVATPAFAQSFSHDFGTGNVINEPALEQAGRTNANSAFAQAPETKTNRKTRIYSGADSDSPTETGGGSEGYNWNLSHDY